MPGSTNPNLCLVHADSHKDLLDVTKGKYLTTPPTTSFEYKNKGIYYAPYTVFNTAGLNVIDASNGTILEVITHLSIHQHVHLVIQGLISNILQILKM